VLSALQFMRLCTALSLAICYPTVTVVPHAIINGYNNVLVVTIELDYSFPLDEKVEYLKYLSKFVLATTPIVALYLQLIIVFVFSVE